MGDVDKSGVDTLAELDDLGAHLVAQLGIQVGKGFVHQEYLGIADHGSADGYTLALAAGQGLGFSLQILGDVQNLCDLPYLAVDFVLGYFSQLQGKCHILVNRHVGVEGVALEYHGDIAVFRLYVVYQLAVNVQLAAGNVFQAGHHTQGGGFSASGRTYQDDEFFVVDRQVHIMDCSHLVVINFLETLQ